jgi:heme/copper-type cytochrome/quinol oxidase subunit 3
VDAPDVHVLALYWHFVDVVWIILYPLIYLVAPRI